MENIMCTQEINIWALMLISFAVGYVMPTIGRYVKEKYGGIEQE